MTQSSDMNVSLLLHSPSLHSPVVAMAEPCKYVADRHINLPETSCFVIASPAELLCMIPGQLLAMPVYRS